ncbi:MFS transporter [Dactylosporangium sp. NPDC048998]|uniref:MFS transporter n=1 Tax=Dactylosporangium sp. NPDC048998 TaxID=3363976 RepID=UPI003724C065
MSLLPPPGVARSLCVQSLIYAVGNGVFLTGSAVFFLHVTGLTPVQIGIGFSVAGALSLLLSVPLGGLADRFGGRRTWLFGVLAEAFVLMWYPWIHGFGAFLALLPLAGLAEAVSGSGRAVYQAEVLPRQERVRSLAFVRSAMNIGFFAGGAIAAVPLAVGTGWAYRAMVLGNALGLLVNAVLVARMPEPPETVRQERAARPVRRGAVWRDRPFLAVVALCSVLAGHASLTSEVIPLWLVAHTDAPKVTLAVLFGCNTATCVALQVAASRGADSPTGISRALRRGGIAVAAACAPLYLSGYASGWMTIALLLAGSALVTLGELWQSAGYWGVTTELPPPAARGAYVGAARMSHGVQSMLGPASLTYLAMHGGGLGWLAIAFVFVLGSLAVTPAMTWVTATPRVALTTVAA